MSNIKLLLVLSLAAFGCVDQAPDHQLTKEEAAKSGGKADNGDDFCALFHWYGDGVCDAFCPKPDPDCTTGAGTCVAAGGKCMTSFQFPTSAPSCENEFNVAAVAGTCPQINQSCCATH